MKSEFATQKEIENLRNELLRKVNILNSTTQPKKKFFSLIIEW